MPKSAIIANNAFEGSWNGIGADLQLNDILQDHVDIVIESQQGPGELLVALHDNPDARADTFVDKL